MTKPGANREAYIPTEVMDARMEDPDFPEVLERARAKARQDPNYVPPDERERRLAEADRRIEELVQRFNARGPAQLRAL